MSRATGDRALREKAAALVDGWTETLDRSGDVRMRPYGWEKLVGGLVDLHLYADVSSAMPLLARTTEWAVRSFDRSRRSGDIFDFQGVGPGKTSEWYTMPENLYRAHVVSGDSVFKEFAEVWLYEDYWRRFEKTSSPEEVVAVHAYSHVNSFSSAAMAYAVTGD